MPSDTHPLRRLTDHADIFSAELPAAALGPDEATTLGTLLSDLEGWAVTTLDDARIDRAARLSPELLAAAGRLGLFGLAIPRAHGGSGLSMKAVCRIVESLAGHSASLAVTVGLHAGLGLHGLVRYGSAELQAQFLPRLASGELIAAFAATEAGAGSDIGALATIAEPDGAGRFRLNGSKIYVTNGGYAGVYTLLVRTPGLGGMPHGASLFLLTRDQPGLEVGPEDHKLGLKGSSTTTLQLHDVPAGVERIIGPPGRGFELLGQILAWGRSILGAGCLGSARRCHRLAVEHAGTRVQFGQPIGRFGQVAERIAAGAADLYAMESLLRAVNLLHDRLEADIRWESAILKVHNSESACRIADAALQIHGGAGYLETTGIALPLRDLRVAPIFEGANEVLRLHIVAEALKFSKARPRLPPLAEQLIPTLREMAEAYDRLAAEIFEALAEARQRHRARIFRRQLVLKNLADALIALYTLGAVLLRTDGELRLRPEPDCDRELRCSQWLLLRLGRQIETALCEAQRDDMEDLAHAIAEAEFATRPDP